MTRALTHLLCLAGLVIGVLLVLTPPVEGQRVNGTSQLTGTCIDTGFGCNEVYDQNQNVQTGDSPQFNALTLGSAGVAMTQDGDGAMTLTGAGNGTDEDLTINLDDTANTVSLSSSTGVTSVNFGTIFVNTPRIYISTVLTLSGSAPTISSGFGTSPSVTTSNGTAAFTVNVGTGGSATTGVVAMGATATNGWHCSVQNLSAVTSTVFTTKQTATAATTVTVGNYDAAGSAAAWTASNILSFACVGR